MDLCATLICANLVFSIAALIRYHVMKRDLAKAKSEEAKFERLWLGAWQEWMKANGRYMKIRADRDLWRRQWKEGAFEMDAATMARLAEQEEELSL